MASSFLSPGTLCNHRLDVNAVWAHGIRGVKLPELQPSILRRHLLVEDYSLVEWAATLGE